LSCGPHHGWSVCKQHLEQQMAMVNIRFSSPTAAMYHSMNQYTTIK
jgi:hypothetical protein